MNGQLKISHINNLRIALILVWQLPIVYIVELI